MPKSMPHDIFISYSHADVDNERLQEWIKSLTEALKKLHLDVAVSHRDINPENILVEQLETDIRGSRALVTVLPRDFKARPNIMFELGMFTALKRPIIALSPSASERSQLIDFSGTVTVQEKDPEAAARIIATTLSEGKEPRT